MWFSSDKSSNAIFADRADAGCQLAEIISCRNFDQPPLIMALPRGGVIVGYEIARKVSASLEVLIVMKIGAPDQPELALGAVVDAEEPQIIWNENLVNQLKITETYKQQAIQQIKSEIKQRKSLYYCYENKRIVLSDHTVILVDDGIATGATTRAALKGLKNAGVKSLMLAVPVAPPDTLNLLQTEVDTVVCLHSPFDFMAVGNYYRNFRQISDEQVKQRLRQI